MWLSFGTLKYFYKLVFVFTLINILNVIVSLDPTSYPTICSILYSVILKSSGTSLSYIILNPPSISNKITLWNYLDLGHFIKFVETHWMNRESHQNCSSFQPF